MNYENTIITNSTNITLLREQCDIINESVADKVKVIIDKIIAAIKAIFRKIGELFNKVKSLFKKKEKIRIEYVEKVVEKEVPVEKTVIKEVPVEKITEVIKKVPVVQPLKLEITADYKSRLKPNILYEHLVCIYSCLTKFIRQAQKNDNADYVIKDISQNVYGNCDGLYQDALTMELYFDKKMAETGNRNIYTDLATEINDISECRAYIDYFERTHTADELSKRVSTILEKWKLEDSRDTADQTRTQTHIDTAKKLQRIGVIWSQAVAYFLQLILERQSSAIQTVRKILEQNGIYTDRRYIQEE
jgi:hypothetical protein